MAAIPKLLIPQPPQPPQRTWQQRLGDLANELIELAGGCLLFLVVGLSAVFLHRFVEWMPTQGVHPFIFYIFKAIEFVAFIGDAVYFLSFFLKKVMLGTIGIWK